MLEYNPALFFNCYLLKLKAFDGYVCRYVYIYKKVIL